MGLYAGYWAVTVTGIKHGQMWILTRAAMSCQDATGLLKWSDVRLAEACRMTVRCLETNIPRLSKLELLKRADAGFRVVGWLASEKFSEKFSERKKEPKKENTGKDLNTGLDSSSDDALETIEAIAKRYRIPTNIAATAYYTAQIRHVLIHPSDPIRSVQFYAQAVEEVKAGPAPPLAYIAEYLPVKLREAKEAKSKGVKA